MNDITAVQRDSSLGDGYSYDLTQQTTEYRQNGTVNLGTGTVTGGTDNTLTFDGCGNRTVLNAVPQTYNNMNQPTGGTFNYDNEGCLLAYNGWIYIYDAQNRLTNATNGTTTAQFYYDGKNRQIARSINGAVTFSVWDDWELIEEYGTGNVRTAAYLQGAHGPIKSLVGTAIYFYQDGLGSTSHIADATGHLLEYYKYNLYGAPSYWSATNTQLSGSNYNVRDLFSGERYIPELGLYDLRNRFMSPELGRFLQPDPIGFKGDASNLYRYCGNDWANRTDPMGLQDPNEAKAQNSPANDLSKANCTVDKWGKITVWFRGAFSVSSRPWESGAIEGGSTKVNPWEKQGNWAVANDRLENHYTDDKLKSAEGYAAAGLTTAELRSRAEKDGSVTPILKVDWKVRNEVVKQDKHGLVVGAELNGHVNRWSDKLSQWQNDRSAKAWFGSHHYSSTSRAAEAVRQFFGPSFREEATYQRATFDSPLGEHRRLGTRFHLED